MPEMTGKRPNLSLREERLRHRWSQQEVADRIGTTPNSVSRWELGVTFPGPYFRGKLCDLFDKSAPQLGLDSHAVEDGKGPAPQSERHVSAAHHVLFPSVWNVPSRRNPFFTGREDVLTRLHETLYSGKVAALTQVQAITGLGGIGKTQTAIEYAYRSFQDYQTVLWVRADTRETLLLGFATLADVLHLSEKVERHPHRVVEAVKHWLQEHTDWLLILDNSEDLTMVSEVLPSIHSGHILVTTRSQVTGTLAHRIVLDSMEPEEGALFLLRRSKLIAPDALLESASTTQYASARALVEVLGGLPLALDQAGAYIEETAGDVSGYLDRYRRQRAVLLNFRGTGLTDHPESVSITLALSIEQVEQTNPAAADLLRLCAFFHPDAIPEELISDAASELGPVLQPVAADPCAWDAAIGDLRRFSLLRRHAEAKTLTIHRLVQAVLRDRMDERTGRQWAERVVRAVNRVYPDMDDLTFVSWQRSWRYLPQADACATLIEHLQMTFPDAVQLLKKAGDWLLDLQRYEQAAMVLRQALTLRERVLGEEHPEVAKLYNDLALTYLLWGKFEAAAPLCQRALSIRTRSLGPLHPDVAESYNDLASIYTTQGKYAEAEPLYLQALSICEQVPGPVQNYVAICLTNLGALYRKQGKYTQAEHLLQQGLTNWKEVLAPTHPNVAVGLDALAELYREQGRYGEAETLCQQALTVREQALGPDHPRTLQSLALLAKLSHLQGCYVQAESFYQRALALCEQHAGPEHPRLADTLTILADLSERRGEYGRAEHLCQRVLAIFEQSFGAEHFFMVEALNILGRLYEDQGDDEQAESVLRRALAIAERKAGTEHPEMAHSLALLASLSLKQGRPLQAGLLYRRALAIWEKTLGSDHPEVAPCLERFKGLLQKSKGRNQARASKGQAGPRRAADTRRSTPLAVDEVDGVPTVQLETDPLAPFLSEYCLFRPQAWCSARDLWQAYQDWTHESGERFPLSRRVFARYVKARGAVPDRTNTRRIWRGIALSGGKHDVTPGDAR
jgi:tetratricopeptide (TPR) repeat protein/transcriptional regulator with XRE-family HTH domain